MSNGTIVLAGATGKLGSAIARALRDRGATVRALVRHGATSETIAQLEALGVSVAKVDFAKPPDVKKACTGAACVVSALAGLRNVVVDVQRALVAAAVEAGVPRFIPSDFSIDFTKLASGTNRNLDLRRELHAVLANTPIASTTIFNGAFTELLTGPAPLVLFELKRVLYWDSADQRMDFTTLADTAAFTASAALDATTPRYLRIAGDQLSARELVEVATEVTGKRFRLLRAGGLRRLDTLITVTRALTPQSDDVYPPWQGMQYLRDMFGGRAKLESLDNERYPELAWTSARTVLATSRLGSA